LSENLLKDLIEWQSLWRMPGELKYFSAQKAQTQTGLFQIK
jgi:hypothetical protein